MGMYEYRLITLILCGATIGVSILVLYRDKGSRRARLWIGRLGVVWVALYLGTIILSLLRIWGVL